MRGQERVRFASPSERKFALTAPAFLVEPELAIMYLTK